MAIESEDQVLRTVLDTAYDAFVSVGEKGAIVVILTSSKAEEDIVKSYDHGANCYVSRPVDFHSFMEVIKEIESFWLTIVKLPPR